MPDRRVPDRAGRDLGHADRAGAADRPETLHRAAGRAAGDQPQDPVLTAATLRPRRTGHPHLLPGDPAPRGVPAHPGRRTAQSRAGHHGRLGRTGPPPPGHTGRVTTGPTMTGVDDAGNGSARRRRVDPERRIQLLKDLEELVLAEGFLALSMDDLAHRLHCSKATLYSVAGNKEQLVVALTKGFFREATEQIEQAVADVADPRLRIPAYLSGVGRAMSRCSTQFYADMVG